MSIFRKGIDLWVLANLFRRTGIMFALIEYAGNLLEICSKKQIKRRDGQNCIVTYKGCKYQGKLIASSGKCLYII